MRTSSIALALAVLWIISLLTLFAAVSGSDLFVPVTLATSILAGIGMLSLVWTLSSTSDNGLRYLKLGIGSVGAVVYVASNALTLVRPGASDELERYLIGGLAVYAIWMILDSLFPGVRTELALRRLEAVVGIGFLLLFVSVLALGAVGPAPQAGQSANTLMITVQAVGGLTAYFGFPIWLFLLARRTRTAPHLT